MGMRPATPGTIVVLAATVLLILVTVSVPLLKSLYFLKATINANVSGKKISGTVTLGTFGYCVGDTCTSAKLGYSLNVAELLGVSGSLGGISNSVLKWITYLLILHPIAAGLGLISVVFGLLAHTHNFAGTTLSTCFASCATTAALLAFIFDIVAFIIAKKRIESSSVGGKAELGNAIWMTLAALILFAVSGFFFGCGTCLTRRRRREQQVSDSYRPSPDEEYGAKLRAEAVKADFARKEASNATTLPNFPEHVPLTAVHDGGYDDGYDRPHDGGAYEPRPYAWQGESAVGSAVGVQPSLVSGVGEGYGRRNPSAPGQHVSFTPETAAAYLPPSSPVGGHAAVGAGTGVGSRLAAEARANRGRATQEDERRLAGESHAMYDASQYGYGDQPQPQVGTYGQDQGYVPGQQFSPTYAGAYPPYPAVSPPPPQGGSSHAQGYQASTPAPPVGTGGYGDKVHPAPPVLPYRPSPSPPAPQQHAQQFYVQNPAPSAYGDPLARAGETGSLAPTYYTHEQAGAAPQRVQYGGAGYGAGTQQDPYGAPAGYDGARRY